MRRAITLVIVASVFVVAGCSDTDSADSTDAGTASEPNMSLSEAFCNDLEAGSSPFQILGQSVKDGTYTPEKAADLAYGFAAISCPGQLKSNEKLRVYLQNWNIDPDA